MMLLEEVQRAFVHLSVDGRVICTDDEAECGMRITNRSEHVTCPICDAIEQGMYEDYKDFILSNVYNNI